MHYDIIPSGYGAETAVDESSAEASMVPVETTAASAGGSVPAATRHPAFDGILGQGKLVDRLRELAEGCNAGGRVIPPILLVGPSGGGKTQLAHAVAVLLGVGHIYSNCSAFTNLTSMLDLHERLSPYDVSILDEIDKSKKDIQTAFLSILDGRPVRRPARTGRHPEPERLVEMPPLTFVAATTRPGKMMQDLLNRFLVFELESYKAGELAEIAMLVARSEGISLADEAASLIAGSCHGSPREVKKRVGELCLTSGISHISKSEVDRFLCQRGIHSEGWTATHFKILGLIGESGSSKARVYTQAGLDPVLVENFEAQLVRAGLVAIEKGHGRTLTSTGRAAFLELSQMFG